jgi:hypothetical protein
MARDTVVKKNANNILIKIPITGNGRWVCKDYVGNNIGQTVSTQSTNILSRFIVEWQITYYEKGTTNFFELSEILKEMKSINLISQNEIDDLKNEVNNITSFLADIPSYSFTNDLDENGFSKGCLKLPMLRKTFTNGLIIDVIIRKQQKGTSLQPMIFLLIPISNFQNQANIINIPATSKTYGELIFDTTNREVLFDLVRVFGKASLSHKRDIMDILNRI